MDSINLKCEGEKIKGPLKRPVSAATSLWSPNPPDQKAAWKIHPVQEEHLDGLYRMCRASSCKDSIRHLKLGKYRLRGPNHSDLEQIFLLRHLLILQLELIELPCNLAQLELLDLLTGPLDVCLLWRLESDV
jgi:hypothetical protein